MYLSLYVYIYIYIYYTCTHDFTCMYTYTTHDKLRQEYRQKAEEDRIISIVCTITTIMTITITTGSSISITIT